MRSRPVCGDLREGVAVDPDPGPRQPIRHDIAHGGAENGERTGLRRHEHQLEVPAVHALRALRGHQRELVQRQRPHRANRLDECEAPGVALLDILHDALEGRVGVRVPKRGDVFIGLNLPGADRHEQGVVLNPPSVARVDDLSIGIDPRKHVLRPVGARVTRDAPQRIVARRPRRERLAHGHGAVDELLVGGDQLDVHRVSCQPSQPKETFDRCDPTATDNYPKIAHATSVRLGGRPAIGALPRQLEENYVE